MSATTHVCVQGQRWLITRLKSRSALAPLTGQDRVALAAFLHLLELYALGDRDGRCAAAVAMKSVLGAMQPKCRWIAKAAIPHVFDWDDEDRIWNEIDAEPIEAGEGTGTPR